MHDYFMLGYPADSVKLHNFIRYQHELQLQENKYDSTVTQTAKLCYS